MSRDHGIGLDSNGDDIILIVGLTGVGKSTFINAAAGQAAVSVGHDLQSCTKSIEPVKVPYRSRRIALVDTPGFDDTWVGDKQILGRIVDWLARSPQGTKLAGIIYLHDISQARIEPAKENLKTFNMLCQPPAYMNIVFATSKWSNIPADVGMRREQQLQSEHWTGSNVARFENTYESASAIVDLIFEKEPVDVVLFHKELVNVQSCLNPKAQARISGGFFKYLFRRLRAKTSEQ